MVGTNFFAPISSTCWVSLTDENSSTPGTQLAVLAKCIGTPPTTANVFEHGCTMIQIDSTTGSNALFQNTGSPAIPVWTATSSSGAVAGSAYSVGAASNFAVLATTATTFSLTGSTVATGNIGETTYTPSSPATTFVSGSDTGTASPYSQAVSDIATLWNQLKGLTGTAISTPGTFDTRTYVPGIYTTASAIVSPNPTVITLNGSGDYVFVSTGGAITFGANTSIVLTNGATADRVYWVANNAFTSGATCTLVGNFLTGLTGDITIGSTNTLQGRLLSGKANVIDGTATTLSLPAVTSGTLGNTIINGSFEVLGKVNGQLYENATGSSVTLLKMHNHSTTAGVGTMEAKGESVNDTGTFYGNYTNYDYTPTSASVAPTDIEGSLSNIRLTTGKTMTTGNLVGFTGQAINEGTLNGAGVSQFGLIGSVAGTGAATSVTNVAGVASSVGTGVVNPSSGTLSSFLAGNLGTTVIDNALTIQNAGYTTNLFSIDTSSTNGCATTAYTGNTAWAQNSKGSFTQIGQIRIKVDGNTYYIPYGTIA